jgi:hypothetical protein
MASKYSTKTYWDERFLTETHYEWLCTYEDIAPLLAPYLGNSSTSTYWVLGTGSSALPWALALAHPAASVLATDYSECLIGALSARQAPPNLCFALCDMLDIGGSLLRHPCFGSVDAIFDKGALDAIVSAEGDQWDPNPALLAASLQVVRGVHAALREGGRYIVVSFSQPHFRAQHLLQSAGRGAAAAGEAPGAPCCPGGGPGALESKPAGAQGEEEEEWEDDKNPHPIKAAIPPVEASLWREFSWHPVDRGLGVFLYVCTK